MPPQTLSPQDMLKAQGGNTPPTPTLSTPQPTPGVMSPQDMVKAQSPTPDNSFVGAGKWLANSVSNIEKPLVSVAAIPIQLVAKAMGRPDPYAGTGILGEQGGGFPSIPGSDSKTVPVSPIDTKKGLMQKAGEIAQVGSMAVTPEASGISGIIKLGLLGAAGSAATYVGEGGQDLNPFGGGEMSNTVRQGFIFGGILGALGNAARVISGTEKLSSGIDPAMANELSQTRPSTVANYIQTAGNSAKDFHSPTVDDLLNKDIGEGANILRTKILPDAGKAVGNARKAAGETPIAYQAPNGVVSGPQAVPMLVDDVNNVMQEMTGHQFSDYALGDEGGLKIDYPGGASTKGLTVDPEGSNVTPLPGRSIQLSAGDKKTLENIHEQLSTLSEKPTVQTASDILRNLDSKIDWTRPQFGEGSSPVDGLLRYVRGAVNKTIAPAAPDLAAANEVYGHLADVRSALGKSAGNHLQNLDLLARRTLYSGQSGKAQSVLDSLYEAVKGHLPPGEESYTTKAIIARFAKDHFGGKTSKTGFAQGISSGDVGALASGWSGRVASAAARAAKKALSPDVEQYAMSISKGEPYSFVPGVHHIDEFLDSPSSARWISSTKKALKQMGVSSSVVGGVAKDTLRMIMFNNLMNSAANQPSNKRTLSQ